MTVRDLMREDVVTAVASTPIDEVAALMRDENVGSVVIEGTDGPAGIVTDRDLAVDVLAESGDPTVVTAGDVMTPDPVTIDVDAGVFDLVSAMSEAAVRRMPVVDGDELVGIIALDDLIVLLARELDNLAGVIAAESPPY